MAERRRSSAGPRVTWSLPLRQHFGLEGLCRAVYASLHSAFTKPPASGLFSPESVSLFWYLATAKSPPEQSACGPHRPDGFSSSSSQLLLASWGLGSFLQRISFRSPWQEWCSRVGSSQEEVILPASNKWAI